MDTKTNTKHCAYARQMVAKARKKEPGKTPKWVNDLVEHMAGLLVERHILKGGEVWGLAKADPDQDLPYDEQGSALVIAMARRYNLFEQIGGFNKTAKQAAIRFWQAWQDPKTGRFFDPRNPNRVVNEKYVPILLAALDAKPLYPFSFSSKTGQADTRVFLQRTKDDPSWEQGGWAAGSHTGFMAVEIFRSICDQGRIDLIPDLEKGVEQILAHQGKDGLWGPAEAPLAGRIGGTLKVIGRLYFQLGMMIPRAKKLADSLIAHEMDGDWFRASLNFCIPRNVTEMLAFCLETLDYRRADLFTAMQSNLYHHRAHLNPDGSWSPDRGVGRGGFCDGYALGMLGGYLHWADCRFNNPSASWPLTRGTQFKHRLKLRDDGKVKVVKAPAYRTSRV